MNEIKLDNLNRSQYTTRAFSRELISLREKDDKIVLLCPDVARSTDSIEFMEKFPMSFFNMGISEQNAIGAAAGMARGGLKPYVAMFSSFASKRALDFLFADICYPNKKVVVVATHSGTSFGEAGPTHHSLSDISITKTLPNLVTVVPCDYIETKKAIEWSIKIDKPMYIRINRGEDFDVYGDPNYNFEIGKAVTLKEGKDVAVIACGSCVKESLFAAYALQKEGISVKVVNMHTISPIDKEAIIESAKTKKIITVEDGRNSGLGGSVAEVILDNNLDTRLVRLGVSGISAIGSHKELMKQNGVDKEGVIRAIKGIL